MDLRKPVLAILVGGTPAPGINAAISSVTLEALNQGCLVIGFLAGFEYLKDGRSEIIQLQARDVTRIHDRGGTILQTSLDQLTTIQDADNCLRVLEHRRVRYLVTIGGILTAHSAMLVMRAARSANWKLSTVHLPKTIFNDLPLPPDALTFGFDSAIGMCANIVSGLQIDARSRALWYFLIVAGKRAGHLALSVGKATAATATFIPEDFTGREGKLTLSELCDYLEAMIYKRRAFNKHYGVALISEGLVNLMGDTEIQGKFGSINEGYKTLGRAITSELGKRVGTPDSFIARNVGNECYGARPSVRDILLARDLGFGATRFLLEGGTGCMVTLQAGKILALPLKELVDPSTGRPRVRLVDRSKIFYRVAQNYMIRLRKEDLENPGCIRKMAKGANLPISEFLRRFAHIAI